ncbi:tautomerase family protein [Nocardioides sp. NPDC051685]|uniref:tautomerase family protein n=1 Tax=Nocardioides sp. NPDC051685 TaxID=3364334 RepID=UPI0037886528
MPFWQVFTPEGAYTDDDKQALAQAITDACISFAEIPAFFVNVYFHEMAANNTYLGGQQRDDFIHIATDIVARQLPTPEIRAACMSVINDTIRPFVQDRGFHVEIHLDQTPVELWRVEGITAPLDYPELFDQWIKENRAVPWEVPVP